MLEGRPNTAATHQNKHTRRLTERRMMQNELKFIAPVY
jgi:hypothetical protein